ncbi:MAG TPA: GNAT family N-acetyltransferase [Gemmataceae bacterium]|jgi:GNAT superfamily N-acetyltransferase|nr:GNAT family N-acetyltransferase [Gemmataceae bacterium]
MGEWLIERLDRLHARGEFRCGKAPLDNFLHSLVGQYEKRRLGRTYVAVRPGEKRVYGYYTLASGAVSFQHLPAKAAKKLPRHPVPVALLARLAVDQAVQGSGLGKFLLTDALMRCLDLSRQLGIHAVEVDAIDKQAKDFYQRFSFVPLEDNELHLYLPMATVEEAFKAGGQ